MITKEQQTQIKNTIGMLSSMVIGGENHSETSMNDVKKTIKLVNDLSQHFISGCTYVVKDFEDGLNYMNSRGEWTKHKQFAKIYTETEAKTIAKINEGRTKLYKG